MFQVSSSAVEFLTQVLELKVGYLLVKYLGVSLIFEKLTLEDCKPLLEKITGRINTWTGRFLSFAGRLQLIVNLNQYV